MHTKVTKSECKFIESAPFFFLATAAPNSVDSSIERLQINGTATINYDKKQLEMFEGTKLLIDIHAHHICPNYPRYIPALRNMKLKKICSPRRICASRT